VESLPRVLTQPDPLTNNAIWIIIVLAFSAVMLGSAYVLVAGVGTKLEAGATYVTQGGTVLTLFTPVVAFLAGLLSPSQAIAILNGAGQQRPHCRPRWAT